MAICVTTDCARAPTGVNDAQVLLVQTLNVRRLPGAGGDWAIGGEVCARPTVAKFRLRSSRRSIRSNVSAADPRDREGVIPDANNEATTAGVADCSANEAEVPGLPPADCGNTRYSAESVVEVLAANVTQPESVAGSTEI